MGKTTAAWLTLLMLCSAPGLAEGLRGDEAFATGDYATAYREWREIADAGDASAMSAVGSLYDYGRGVPQDFAEALAWYRRAAEAGDVRAMFNTGAMYDNGRGTAGDRLEAIRWYGMAADKGNGRAAYNLGVIYRDGDGVPRDTAAAIKAFRIAAAAGVEAARTNLAALGGAARLPEPPSRASAAPPVTNVAGATGGRSTPAALARVGVDPVYSKRLAATFPALAVQADRGNALAQYDVGFAYEFGIGVPADPVKAYVYYLRASGSRDASTKAAALGGAVEIRKQLSSTQQAAARDILLSTIR